MMIRRLDGDRAEAGNLAFNKRWVLNSEDAVEFNMFLFNADSVDCLFELMRAINTLDATGDVKGMDNRKRRILGIKSERGCTLFIHNGSYVEVVYERSVFENLEHAIAV